MRFEDLGIGKPILRAIREMGYDEPTPIQQQAIRPVAEGRDLMGCAQTGTGKTAAFSIPILQRLGSPREGEERPVRALILTPTRELALQIYENICQYGRYTGRVPAVIFGGVSQVPQVEALKRGADILIATPGRLWDLMGQGLLDISRVECFVLDEADRMLDMGFIHDVKRILEKLPQKRQTLLFSATIPDEVAELAAGMLRKPVKISVTPSAKPVEKIEQGVYFVEKKAKRELLQVLLRQRGIPQTLVFVRTKHGADRVARDLNRAGISAKAIHGDKSQGARQSALALFKEYKIAVLVATDIAARGIDINELPLVVNFDLPNIPETYVHRIGRTGRAGMEGTALSFCDMSEMPYLADIEKLTGIAIPALEPPAGIGMTEASSAARYVANTAAALKEAAVSASAKSKKKTGMQPKQAEKKAEKPAEQLRARKQKQKQKANAEAAAAQQPGKPAQKTALRKAETGKTAEKTEKQGTKNAGVKYPEAKPAAQRSAGRKAPVKKAGKQPQREIRVVEPTVSVQKAPVKKAAPQRRAKREADTRVDVATGVRSGLSESTAARIRAKVEAKLAERRTAQEEQAARKAAVQPRAAKSRKTQKNSGRGRGRR